MTTVPGLGRRRHVERRPISRAEQDTRLDWSAADQEYTDPATIRALFVHVLARAIMDAGRDDFLDSAGWVGSEDFKAICSWAGVSWRETLAAIENGARDRLAGKFSKAKETSYVPRKRISAGVLMFRPPRRTRPGIAPRLGRVGECAAPAAMTDNRN